jgi:hypothetical protein
VVSRRAFDEETIAGSSSEAVDFRDTSELFSAGGRTLGSSDLATVGKAAGTAQQQVEL